MSTPDIERAGDVARREFRFPPGVVPSPDPIPTGETPEDAADRRALQAGNRRKRFDRQRPALFAEARVGDLVPEVQAKVLDWLAGPSLTLVLAGNVGVGKTYAAWALASHAVAGGVEVAGWTVPDFLVAIAPDGDDSALAIARRVPLLLLDDLGVEKPSEWRIEQMTALFDVRVRENRRQVVTTNSSYRALEDRYGERAMSRLTGGGVPVLLDGPDRRRVTW